jgi:hypothetical protein
MNNGDSSVPASTQFKLETQVLRFLTREAFGIPMALIVCAAGAVGLGLLLAWSGASS